MPGRVRHAASIFLPLAAAACAHGDRPAEADRALAAADWRTVATAGDRARLRGWRDSWTNALARAAAAGKQADIAAQGALLNPDAGQGAPAPPAGDYRCRTVKLGAKGPGMLDYMAYPAFACRVAREGEVLSLTKLAGSQRPVGLLFPDDGTRMIFLGTMMLGDERMAQQYGRDPERDMIGFVERVGAARWRLVLPAPRWESLIDVVELVPATG